MSFYWPPSAFAFAIHAQQYLIQSLQVMSPTIQCPHLSRRVYHLLQHLTICLLFESFHLEAKAYQQDTSSSA
jgi:hypothetical protein